MPTDYQTNLNNEETGETTMQYPYFYRKTDEEKLVELEKLYAQADEAASAAHKLYRKYEERYNTADCLRQAIAENCEHLRDKINAATRSAE